MEKIKIKAYVFAKLHDWGDDEVSYYVFSFEASNQGYILLEEIEIETDRPSRESLVNGTVAALRELQSKKRADAERECTQIDERIQSLLCLENKPSEV